MNSVVPGSAFGLAADQSGGAGVPLVVLFERDDAVAVPLLTQLRLAGYDVRAARTPVELFDTLRKHAVALILVDLGSAAVSRREFWVALDAQRRGRAIQVVTFRTGVGPRLSEPDLELSARALADVDLRGARDYTRIVETVRQRVPLIGVGVAESPFIPPLGGGAGYAAPSYAAPGNGVPGYGAPNYGAPGYAAPGYGTPGVPSGYGAAGQPSMAFGQGAQGNAAGGIAGLPGLGGLPTASPFPMAGIPGYPISTQPSGAPGQNGANGMAGFAGAARMAPSPFAQPTAANPFAGPVSPPPLGAPAFGQNSMPATPPPGMPGPASSPFAQPYSTNPFGSNPSGSNPFGSNPTGGAPWGSSPGGSNPWDSNPSGGSPFGSNAFGSNPSGTNLGNIFGGPSSTSRASGAWAPSSRPGTGAPFDPVAAETALRAAYGLGGPPALGGLGGGPLGGAVAGALGGPLRGRDASAMATAAPASESEPVQDAWMPPGGEELIGTAPLPDRFNEGRGLGLDRPQGGGYQESWPGASLASRPTEAPLPLTDAALNGAVLNSAALNDLLKGIGPRDNSAHGASLRAAREETLPIAIPEGELSPTGPLDGQEERALGTVLVEGALLTPRKLEALQGIRRMLGTIGVKAKLGELALHFHLLSPDQLLAALLVSRHLVTPQQIAGLGRVKQEMAASGMDYDLEALLIMFGILPAEELSQLRAELA